MENKATKRTNRLGRGLSALIPDISTEIDKKDIITIDLKNIYPNQDQPRRVFDEEKIKILSESIKNYGVLQPIVLKPDDKGKYMIIAGERRYRASKLARKSDIPAVIKDIPMKDIMEIALIENLQRGLSTQLQSMTCRSSCFSIASSQSWGLLPFSSRNGCATFISTYFSTISSEVDCGIRPIWSRCSSSLFDLLIG